MQTEDIVTCNKCKAEWHEPVITEKETNSTMFKNETVECYICGETEDFTIKPDYQLESVNKALEKLANAFKN